MKTNDPGADIQVRIEPSRIMLVFLISLHLVAVAALWLADLHILVAAALTFAIVCYGIYAYGRFYRLTHTLSVHTIRLDGDEWMLGMSDGRQLRASLSNEVVIFSWFTAIQFQEVNGRKKHAVAMFRDSADRDALRRLRVWLRHGISKA
jgi:hypothetical protein